MILLASEGQTRYPNQKVIRIEKAPIGKGDYYLRIRKDRLRDAARKLKAGAFKLYIYLAKKQDGYCFALSSKDVAQR